MAYSALAFLWAELTSLLCACSIMYGEQARFFDDEIHPTIKHSKKGLLAMAGMPSGLTQAAPERGVSRDRTFASTQKAAWDVTSRFATGL